MATDIKLHLVYAGRGDTLILELDNDFILVDGGPMTREPKEKLYNPEGLFKLDKGYGPYFRYLKSALKTVWGNRGGPPKLRAIVNLMPTMTTSVA